MSKIDKLDALLDFLQENKPYRSKVLDVNVEYKHSEVASVDVNDVMSIEVDYTCNFSNDFYKLYDVVKAFTYTNNNGTITQDLETNRFRDFVSAKVNVNIDNDTINDCFSPPWIPGSSPVQPPSIDFQIVVGPANPVDICIGIAPTNDVWIHLPFVVPDTNSLLGTNIHEYGYRGDGVGITNNVTSSFVSGFTTGDTIRVSVDLYNGIVYFYKVIGMVSTLMGSLTILDTTKQYSFFVSTKNDMSGVSVSV